MDGLVVGGCRCVFRMVFVWRLGGLGMLVVRAGWSGGVGGEGRGWRGMVVYGRFEQRPLMF